MSKLQEMIAQYNEIQKVMKKSAKTLILDHLKESVKDLTFEGVHAVSWVQYTPGFNDGDPCTFTCQADYLQTQTGPDEDWDEGTDNLPSETDNSLNKLQAAVNEVPDDFYEAAFGDGVRVILTFGPRGGLTVETDDYDCGY